VEAGGQVSNNWGYLGYNSGSKGSAMITGAGSRWTNSSRLVVGSSGSGSLTITAGGQVSGTVFYRSYIGLDSGSMGTATITGAGSIWTNTGGDLYVGGHGIGALHVEAGGQVLNTSGYSGYLGLTSGSTGTATISGAGSEWSNSGSLYVGRGGYGALHIAAGGRVRNGFGYADYLGYDAGSTGTATITGIGSKWSSGSVLYVGRSGSGALRVEAGGLVSNDDGHLGYNSGSTATATITGAGAKWTNNGTLYVGNSGSGALRVEAGGQVSNDDGHLGYYSGSTATATITGAGARWTNNGTLYVGNFGSGTLRVEAGGEVSSASGILGSTGSATITGAGSKWTNSVTLHVGYSGSGTLTVEDGGLVTAGTLFASLGDLHGDGTIAAAGAILDADLQFNAAQPAEAVFGFGAGGTLTVTAAGGSLGAGYKGLGSLTISEGVAASSSGGILGRMPSSMGKATISGAGSKWTNSATLYVGNSGKGELRVEAGGLVSNAIGYLGFNGSSTGTATITGAGSMWTNSSDLWVGTSGSGALTITAGGLVSVRRTLRIDGNGDSFVNLTTGGMLALWGDADDSLAQFLGLASGTDAIRYWNASLAGWTPLTDATLGVDYTLQYQTTGDLNGYTFLTVGIVGDLNYDRRVDGADLLAWQRGNLPTPHSPDDLAAWRANFGLVATTPATTAVPEPGTCALAGLALVGLLLTRRSPRRPCR
jgi:T5SS/PEP-CTERM-associated repeat protein